MTKIKSYWEVSGIHDSELYLYLGFLIAAIVLLVSAVLLNPKPFLTDEWFEYLFVFKRILFLSVISAIPSAAVPLLHSRRIEKRDAVYELYLSGCPVSQLIRIINDTEFEGDSGTRGRIAEYLEKQGFAKLV